MCDKNVTRICRYATYREHVIAAMTAVTLVLLAIAHFSAPPPDILPGSLESMKYARKVLMRAQIAAMVQISLLRVS